VWDFVVAGAGPAGSRAAELLARRGARVLMLDPKAPWEKPCGGGLSAAALRHTPDLDELGLRWETISEVLVAAPSGACVILPLRRPFAVISRLELSRWGLERATAAGTTFVDEAVRSVERRDDTWRIADGSGRMHRARWLLGADGAASRLRGFLAPRLKPELAPTRVAYPAAGVPPGLAALLLLPASGGYLWDFPRRGPHSIGVSVAPGTVGRAALDGMVAQYLEDRGNRQESLSFCGAAIPTRPWRAGRFRDVGSRDYALLGDAAGLADPLTGEGIDPALRSATVAAQTFDERLGFARYPRALRRTFRSDGVRARVLLTLVYRSAVVNHLVRNAGRRGLAQDILCALMDAVNEHGSLTEAAWRIIGGSGDRLGHSVTGPRRSPAPRTSAAPPSLLPSPASGRPEPA
jgi:flavin-dependent dehydrogenase